MVNLPVGTLMLFPKNVSVESWIKLSSFLRTQHKYPALKRLCMDFSGVEKVNAGDLQVSIFDSLDECSCYWKHWNNVGSISAYPDLKRRIELWIGNIRDKETYQLWLNALELDTLPNIDDLFIKLNRNTGMFEQGTNGGYFYSYPVIEHTENLLKSVGKSSKEEPKTVYASVSSSNTVETNIPANLVLLGQDPSIHRLKEPAYLLQTGNNEIGKPSNVSMNVKICVADYYPNVPSTHTWFIKYE